MSHRSLFWPITLIVIVAATMILVITSASLDPHAAVIAATTDCGSPETNPAYPDCLKTAAAKDATATTDPARIIIGCPTNGPAAAPPYPPYADCMKTRTALLLQNGQAGSTPLATVPTAIDSGTAQIAPDSPSSATSPPTPTPTSTITAATAATAATAVTGTPQAPVGDLSTPQAAPTATLTGDDLVADIVAIPCIPGDVIPIEGSADPETALIVTFGDRTVGGGFTRNDGSYRIRLRIGDERPGIYLVQVQDRTTRSMIQQFNCEVPAFTPTPTPPIIP